LLQREHIRFYSKTIVPWFFLCMLFILIALIKTPFNNYDEGIAVVNATRVLNGDSPYRNFWTIYPPGQFYTLAAIFKIFGTNLLVARIYDTMVRFLIIVITYLIAKKTATSAFALCVSIVTTVLLAHVGCYVNQIFPSLAFGLLSILSLLQYIKTEQRQWLLFTGVFIGIATLFRLDFGLYNGISIVSAIILFRYARKINKTQNPCPIVFTTTKLLLMVLGSAFFVILPCYSYIVSRSGFDNFWTQVVIFPATVFHDVRWMPYPNIIPFFLFTKNISGFINTNSDQLKWLRFYLPLMIYSIAFFHYGSFFRRKSNSLDVSTQSLGTIALAIFGTLLFVQALSRYDVIHVLPTSIIAFLVMISFVHQVALKNHNRVLRYSSLFFLAVLVYVYFLLPTIIILFNIQNMSPLGCYSSVERAKCIYIEKDQERAIEYVREHTSESESIFVCNRRQDRIFTNNVGFYFLSNRPSGTKYHELHPGVATTRPVQEEIVYNITSANVHWIVLVDVPESSEPNASAISSGVHFLDDFIRSTYVPTVKFDNYEIWKKEIK
jgi:hypothetical protein